MKGLGQETIQVKRCESPSKEQVTELRNTESNKVQEVMIQVKKCKSDKAACCNIASRRGFEVCGCQVPLPHDTEVEVDLSTPKRPWDQGAGITKQPRDHGAGITKIAGSRRNVSNRVTGVTHQNITGRCNRGKLEVHFVNQVEGVRPGGRLGKDTPLVLAEVSPTQQGET